MLQNLCRTLDRINTDTIDFGREIVAKKDRDWILKTAETEIRRSYASKQDEPPTDADLSHPDNPPEICLMSSPKVMERLRVVWLSQEDLVNCDSFGAYGNLVLFDAVGDSASLICAAGALPDHRKTFIHYGTGEELVPRLRSHLAKGDGLLKGVWIIIQKY